MTSEKSYGAWYFLGGTVLFMLILALFNLNGVMEAIKASVSILWQVIPTLLIVFLLMALINYFVKPKVLVKYLGKGAGFKGWVISIVGGIISTGPIYMWYPLLSDLKKHGVKDRFIAAFLYNRAIKIALLPLLIVYFGLKYSVVLLVVMVLVSVLQGMITEKLSNLKIKKVEA